jgi:hypothetical protein
VHDVKRESPARSIPARYFLQRPDVHVHMIQEN